MCYLILCIHNKLQTERISNSNHNSHHQDARRVTRWIHFLPHRFSNLHTITCQHSTNTFTNPWELPQLPNLAAEFPTFKHPTPTSSGLSPWPPTGPRLSLSSRLLRLTSPHGHYSLTSPHGHYCLTSPHGHYSHNYQLTSVCAVYRNRQREEGADRKLLKDRNGRLSVVQHHSTWLHIWTQNMEQGRISCSELLHSMNLHLQLYLYKADLFTYRFNTFWGGKQWPYPFPICMFYNKIWRNILVLYNY